MNIREIKKAIIAGQSIASLTDPLIEYINQRTQTNITVGYRDRLFRLINPTLSDHGLKVFYCHYHDEVEILETDDIYQTSSNDLICEDAYNNHYFTCHDCEEINHSDYAERFDSRSDDELYCASCHDDQRSYCDDCDTVNHQDDHCECENSDDEYNLDRYDRRNKLHFHGKENSILFYGGECELQAYRDQSRSEVVDTFRDSFNNGIENVICKHDGSLDSEKGFEMSTTNCSFDYHKEEFWNDFFELKPAQYCKAYDGYQCGIHWHFNRNAFTENQMRRLNCFYNHPKNKKLIVDIAGRNENNYCKFFPSITFNDPIKTQGEYYKYRVINFNNENTIEIRIFRSNLKQISFFRYLEFIHTVNEWIRSSDVNDESNITWEYYFDWLLKNMDKKFSNLFLFLDDKKHFEHLENIQEWETVYTNFKTIIHDFRINNEELIRQESEQE